MTRSTARCSCPVFLSKANPVPTVIEYYTVDGTATAVVDYLKLGSPANPRTLTIPAGVLQSQINVTIASGTGGAEGDETFSVVIASVSGGDAVGGGSGGGLIIDQTALTAFNPVINVTNGTVIEGTDGQRVAKFYIQLSRPTASPMTFTYDDGGRDGDLAHRLHREDPGHGELPARPDLQDGRRAGQLQHHAGGGPGLRPRRHGDRRVTGRGAQHVGRVDHRRRRLSPSVRRRRRKQVRAGTARTCFASGPGDVRSASGPRRRARWT